jgi:hypothetical protein
MQIFAIYNKKSVSLDMSVSLCTQSSSTTIQSNIQLSIYITKNNSLTLNHL